MLNKPKRTTEKGGGVIRYHSPKFSVPKIVKEKKPLKIPKFAPSKVVSVVKKNVKQTKVSNL